MEDVVPDILESILLRLEVKDLIRCKIVCKLWLSFISSNRFVNAHLKHRYNSDHNNSKFQHRRIVMVQLSRYSGMPSFGYYNNNLNHAGSRCNIVGSSNGLVCIASSCGRILVANPSTRQFRVLPKPLPGYILGGEYPRPIGFGYDSFSDDYKVVLGSSGDCCTRFSVLSLKTNAWKYAEQVSCTYQFNFTFVGALCNGAIHWVMKAHYSKYVIIAFDLSTEELKEIPQPDRGCTLSSWLGIIDGCLCICHPTACGGGPPRWIMKSYNVKSSWTLLPPYDHVPHKVNDAIHTLKSLEGGNYIPHTSFFTVDNEQIELRYKEQDMCAPIFVHSLVSPHVYGRLKRKREPTNNDKLIKGCPS